MHPASEKRKEAYRRGILAEYIAAAILVLKGYRILAHRYKCHSGEIDLIVRKGDTLVFVEVKARAKLADALEAVSINSRRRIARAAVSYMSGDPKASNMTQRFDVMAYSPPFFISHIKNAWFAEY
jgi:putative endonuclease